MSIAEKLTTIADNQQAVFDAGKKSEQAWTDAIITRANVGHYYNDRVPNLGAHCFNYCTSMLSANFPNVTKTGVSSLSSCSSMTEVHLPNLRDVTGQGLFAGCSALEFADVGFANTFPPSAFSGCQVLKTIVIRRDTNVPSLQNLNVFTNTPYASGGSGGKIYVPSALIEQYKTATNWSVLYGYGTVELVQLEGSEYE